MKISMGTFVGNGTDTVRIPINCEPDIIYAIREDESIPATAGIYGFAIVRDIIAQASYLAADTSTTASNGGFWYDIDGLYGATTINASYDNGILTLYGRPGSRIWASDVTYRYKMIKW